MKKIIVMLAMILALSTTYAFTGEDAINKQALNAFKTEFVGATGAAWTVGADYYKVSFGLGDQKLFAFYDMAGQFIAVSRHMSSSQLPLNLQSSLKKFYGDYWVSDLFELGNNDGTTYYATLENADTKIVLKSAHGGDWSLYEKTRKS